MVKSADGALVYWDGQEDLMIKLPDTFKTGLDGQHQVFGLCGTYDDNPENDFASPQGIVAESVNTFIQSWREDRDKCDSKTEIKTPPPCYSPSNSINEGMMRAQDICKVLDGPKFAGCKKYIPTQEYKLMCMSDVCACNSTSRSDCVCKALSLYARACHVYMETLEQHKQDWSIKNWRSDGLCGKLGDLLRTLH